MQPLRAGPMLDRQAFAELRRTLELEHHKWDAQVGDDTAIAPFPLLVDAATWAELAGVAEQLAAETVAIEEELLQRPELHARLGLPRMLRALFLEGKACTPAAARVMRFDFHPTPDGWRVSEVNSDVPGGYSEASELSRLLAAHTPGVRVPGDPGALLADKLVAAAGDGAVALLTAPWHIADHQVVAHLAARIERRGTPARLASPSQLVWRDGRASLPGPPRERALGAILRFFQVEWLPELRPRTSWEPLLVGGRTHVANPAGAALSESKRLPLLLDVLATKAPAWRRVLPETREPRDAPFCCSLTSILPMPERSCRVCPSRQRGGSQSSCVSSPPWTRCRRCPSAARSRAPAPRWWWTFPAFWGSTSGSRSRPRGSGRCRCTTRSRATAPSWTSGHCSRGSSPELRFSATCSSMRRRRSSSTPTATERDARSCPASGTTGLFLPRRQHRVRRDTHARIRRSVAAAD